MTIGERIKEIRKKNGYTQGTLADELQVGRLLAGRTGAGNGLH